MKTNESLAEISFTLFKDGYVAVTITPFLHSQSVKSVLQESEDTLVYVDSEENVRKKCSTWEIEAYIMSMGIRGVVPVLGTNAQQREVVMLRYACDLYQLLATAPIVPVVFGLCVVRWCLGVLLDMAKERVSHGDLKIENVLCRRTRNPNEKEDVIWDRVPLTLALTDFSLSRLQDGRKRYGVSGTIGYQPPEIAYMSSNYFKTSCPSKQDVYAAGIMFVDLLTGKNNVTCPELLVDSSPCVIEQILPMCNTDECSVISSMLHPEQDKRSTLSKAHEQFSRLIQSKRNSARD